MFGIQCKKDKVKIVEEKSMPNHPGRDFLPSYITLKQGARHPILHGGIALHGPVEYLAMLRHLFVDGSRPIRGRNKVLMNPGHNPLWERFYWGKTQYYKTQRAKWIKRHNAEASLSQQTARRMKHLRIELGCCCAEDWSDDPSWPEVQKKLTTPYWPNVFCLKDAESQAAGFDNSIFEQCHRPY